jgi:hypothetical protein
MVAVPLPLRAAVGGVNPPAVIAAEVWTVDIDGAPPDGVTVKVYDVPVVRVLQIDDFCTFKRTEPPIAAQVPPVGTEATTYDVATPSAANETVTAVAPSPATVGVTSAVPSVTARVAGVSVSAVDDR